MFFIIVLHLNIIRIAIYTEINPILNYLKFIFSHIDNYMPYPYNSMTFKI